MVVLAEAVLVLVVVVHLVVMQFLDRVMLEVLEQAVLALVVAVLAELVPMELQTTVIFIKVVMVE
jgi:hypothetical protein